MAGMIFPEADARRPGGDTTEIRQQQTLPEAPKVDWVSSAKVRSPRLRFS